MKPSLRDFKVEILIAGDELIELQKHTWAMAEAFGLDRRIEQYKGKKVIGFYRWDMECLMDVLSVALDDKEEYPDRDSSGYLALKRLSERLRSEYEKNYEHGGPYTDITKALQNRKGEKINEGGSSISRRI